MLFKDQIEKRKELEHSALTESLENMARAIGIRLRLSPKKHTDGDAVKDILHALNITDCMPEEDEFTSPEEQLNNILSARNIMQRHVQLKGKWWQQTIGPLLGRDKQGRLVALTPSRWMPGYTYVDSNGRRVGVNSRRMKSDLEEDAIAFCPALPLKKLTYKDLIRFVVSGIRLSDVCMLLAISLIISLFGMFTPFINKEIFDNLIPNGTQQDIAPIAGLLIGAGIGSLLFGVTRNFLLSRLKETVNARVQPAIMARTFALPANFFMKYSSGELSNRITSITQLCGLLNDVILSSSLTLLFSVVYLAQMSNYAGTLMLPAMGIVLAQAALMVSTFWMHSRHHDHVLTVQSKLSGLVFNLFTGIQKIKLTGSERRSLVRWMDAYAPSVDLKHIPLLLRISPSINSTLQLGGTVLLYFCALKDNISPSDFIAFTSANGMVSGAIMGMAAIVPQLAEINPLLRLASPIMETVPETEQNSTSVEFLTGAIEVTDLTFRYADDLPPVINGLNLKIKPGEYVGIVGRSGCGKSTLLRLLLGFEKPNAGSIYYDDYDLQNVNKQSLRRHIGTCLQSGALFPGDVFSNITITAPWSKQEDAWEAARMANIAKDIEELPMGMHTLISEGGGGFSGGQKQRLLIARALLNSPSIIFFDEATSALDNISQEEVSRNMDKLGCTRLVIAHRLSTIRHCDRIIVLEKGSISEEGTFEELMEKKGLFYEMSKRQL